MGHGLDPSVTLGPLVSKEQHNRVTGFLAAGQQEGAEVVTGGKARSQKGYFIEPTVLAQTNRSMKVVREEIFGPVVCIQSFDDSDLDAVAKFANDEFSDTEEAVGAIATSGNPLAFPIISALQDGRLMADPDTKKV